MCTERWTGLCPLGCKRHGSNCRWDVTNKNCLPTTGSRRVDGSSMYCQTESDSEYHIMGMTTGPNAETYGYWDNEGGAHTDKSRTPDIRGFELDIDGAPAITRLMANRGTTATNSDFKITEVIIYGRRLSQKESQQVVNYLQYKYFSDTGSAPLLEPSPVMRTVKFRTHQLQTHDFMCLLSNDASYIKISDLEIYHPGNDELEYSSTQTPTLRDIYDSLNVEEVRSRREQSFFCLSSSVVLMSSIYI